ALVITPLTRFREQRVKFPKKRRILRPGEVFSLAGFPPHCCTLGLSIRVISHVNFICAMQDIYDVILMGRLDPVSIQVPLAKKPLKPFSSAVWKFSNIFPLCLGRHVHPFVLHLTSC
ncbi:hypothetical protein SFRURICE_015479, partial [Spodoptera frugiperda]